MYSLTSWNQMFFRKGGFSVLLGALPHNIWAGVLEGMWGQFELGFSKVQTFLLGAEIELTSVFTNFLASPLTAHCPPPAAELPPLGCWIAWFGGSGNFLEGIFSLLKYQNMYHIKCIFLRRSQWWKMASSGGRVWQKFRKMTKGVWKPRSLG